MIATVFLPRTHKNGRDHDDCPASRRALADWAGA
jgi:hypothetical protein